ncbi:UDP-2,3-diacylglucosamine diphosphatase [Plasticicumulans acidivorans]|uniref:UDP-2,3-diacylglucosamine hydrolase n=1 Tax=Plasticicumulans acidivorans TaxID=886464 RepID=A0A317N0M5_9GAMM|nr:UDP-2,3-diacylglucosamine diphosphatase [Plasticicumulans acidivorans]PWV62239.1 UDP-2,3-diacylglucosamine hydrolase [Plasticicumulans acidivorans]
MKPTLFISDLHLDASRPQTVELFRDFVAERCTHAAALYILGDLFEAWIGDDDDAELGRSVAASLAALQRQRVPVYFMAGNRDFLLGERFAAAAGMTLLPEASVIDLYGTPTLLLHGDTLCTDDVDYQAFRARMRSPASIAQLLALPLGERRQLAVQLRADSRTAQAGKLPQITDVNAEAVREAMRAHGVSRLIHGHTHRPAIHEVDLGNGESGWRIVLGDWYAQGSVLNVTADDLHLEGLYLH